MSNGLAKKETIDVDAKELKEVSNQTPDKGKEEQKMGFIDKHPVAWRRIKKVVKIVGGLAAVGGTVYAGQRIADSKRSYYTINLTKRDDGDYTAEFPVDTNADTGEPASDQQIVIENQ